MTDKLVEQVARAIHDVKGGIGYDYMDFCRDAAKAALESLTLSQTDLEQRAREMLAETYAAEGYPPSPWLLDGTPLIQFRGSERIVVKAIMKALASSSVPEQWQPIETAPKDGSMLDLWCVPPEDCDFQPERGGIRLTDCAWYEASDVFAHTGWVRNCDDGYWDLVDGPPTAPHGLPRWVPVRWMHLPPPPAPQDRGASQEDDLTRQALEQGSAE